MQSEPPEQSSDNTNNFEMGLFAHMPFFINENELKNASCFPDVSWCFVCQDNNENRELLLHVYDGNKVKTDNLHVSPKLGGTRQHYCILSSRYCLIRDRS